MTRPGPCNPDKLAGVDAIGLLVGSISMCGFKDAVYSALNKQPATDLDRYNQFGQAAGQGVAGLDGNGRPAFYPLEPTPGSILNGDYRMNRADLERSTVLISDLSDIQLGDIILSDAEQTDLGLGIVVGFDFQTWPRVGTDGSGELNHVIVLSVNKALGKVTLSRWDRGQFTQNPQSYQIRRLLKFTGGQMGTYKKDGWELLDGETAGLDIEFAYEQGFKTWIPNTGDFLRFSSISVSKQDSFEGTLAFSSGEDSDVVPTALDYGYKHGDASGFNLYNNTGGGFEFWALTQTGGYLLATMERSGGQEVPPGSASAVYQYKVVPNQAYFDATGKGKGGYRLWVDGNQLVFVGPSSVNCTMFGIRPEAGADQRPGDDLLLGFALASDPMICGQAADGDHRGVVRFQTPVEG